MRHRGRQQWIVHSSAPAPPSSSPDVVCAIGTNNGIMRVVPGAVAAIGPRSWDPASMTPTHAQGSPGNPYDNSARVPARAPREIFDLVFHGRHPQLLLASGREGRVMHADMRTRAVDWSWFRARSTVARLADVGHHGVLVSGPRHNMALYDLRFTKQFRKNGQVDPAIVFPSHRNEAHWDIGLDVYEQLGVVAAAQEDGTVKLFNLRSGAALSSPELHSFKADTPIKAIMFKTVPGEKGPSLFVGEGSCAKKYSWGSLFVDDEV